MGDVTLAQREWKWSKIKYYRKTKTTQTEVMDSRRANSSAVFIQMCSDKHLVNTVCCSDPVLDTLKPSTPAETIQHIKKYFSAGYNKHNWLKNGPISHSQHKGRVGRRWTSTLSRLSCNVQLYSHSTVSFCLKIRSGTGS